MFHLPAPVVIGVDEFAWRRRHRYGTLIVDLVCRQPVDLLPTDTSDEFARWLRLRPLVDVVVQDRDQAYALAVCRAAPAALQVADRFRLVHNLLEAFRTFVYSKRWIAPQPARSTPVPVTSAPSWPVRGPTPRKAICGNRCSPLEGRARRFAPSPARRGSTALPSGATSIASRHRSIQNASTVHR